MAPQLRFQWPERRGPSDPWFRVGNIDVGTTAFVVGLGVLSFFLYALDKSLLGRLAYLPEEITRGQVWRLVTWPMVNRPDIFTAFTLLILWIFGHDLESQFGRIRFTRYLVMLIVVPAVITVGVYYLFGGANSSNLLSLATIAVQGIRLVELGVFVAYVAERPGARFFFGIPAWVLVAVFIALDVLQYLGDRLWLAIVFELVVAGLALVLLRSFGFGDGVAWVPKVPLPSFIVGPGGRAKSRTARSPGTSRFGGTARNPARTGNTGSKGTPAAGPGRRGRSGAKAPGASGSSGDTAGGVVTGPWEGSSSAPVVNELEVDRILDKIAANGMASLSADERRALEEASRRRRDGRT